MRDRPTNQAAGLLDFAVPQPPKLIAMVSHGDEHAELPLLLRICGALVGFGYTVTVLDGSVLETPDNPGLQQLLNFSFVPPEHVESAHWSILPAGLGLQSLSQASHHQALGIAECGWFFPPESVVIVYTSAHSVAALLQGSQVRPLLAMSEAKTSLLTSYLALKRLLIKGKVEPTIVNMVGAGQPQRVSHTPITSLSDCAKHFLNYDVNLLHIPAPTSDAPTCAHIERLALGLLEHGMPLGSGWAYAPTRMGQSFSTPQLAGRH